MYEEQFWLNRDSNEFQLKQQRMGYIDEHGCLQTQILREQLRPSTIYKPKLYMDGNWWCALYGENIQRGVSAFGETPEEAMKNFDIAWTKHISKPTSKSTTSEIEKPVPPKIRCLFEGENPEKKI